MATGVSEKPWSDYTEADYSLEQWARACLIKPSGTPTSKAQCKLPVRTPMGTLSRAGVHAAAAALAGARGGINATAEEKKQAAAALVRLYGKLNEEAPPSLSHGDILTINEVRRRFGLPPIEETSSAASMTHDDLALVQEFLKHFGRKGMKWGQRIFSRGSDGGSESSTSTSPTHQLSDSEQARAVAAKIKKEGLSSVSNQEMQVLVNRMNLQRQYAQLTAQPSKIERGREFVNRQLKTGKTINEAIAFANSPAGKLIFSVMSPTSGRHAVGSRASNRKLTPKAKRAAGTALDHIPDAALLS